MRVLVLEVSFYAPWVHSLKEKRMEVKSLAQRLKNKFNVSVCEAEAQDIHQTIVLGVAAAAADAPQASSIEQNILRFLEANTEAEITDIRRQVY